MIDYSTYSFLRVEIDDGVAIVTMNRPERLNAVNDEGSDELHYRIFTDLRRDDRVNAVVLTGAGKAFCAGVDIKRVQDKVAASDAFKARKLIGGDLWKAVWMLDDMLDLDKPIVAAVNGPAIGIGATIALFSDIIIASENAKFADTHVRIGIVAGDGGTVIWPLLLGVHRAKEYLMTGDTIDAYEADRIGMVNRVVPQDKLMPTALELAKRLAHGPAIAIRGTKRSINKRLKQDVNLLMDACFASELISFSTEDQQEATAAFLEKRNPVFKGR